MQNPQISDKDIEQIVSEDLTSRHWEVQLGIGLVYEYAPKDIKYSFDYSKQGKVLWQALRYELYELLCDPQERKPKEWLKDLINGDIRNLLVGIAAAITTKYDVSLGIAVPCTALMAKSGILKYCGTKPRVKPAMSVADILSQYRAYHAPKKHHHAKKKPNTPKPR